MSRIKPWIWTLVLALAVACNKTETVKLQTPEQPVTPRNAKTITVVGETGQPLANAKVLIGQAKDKPFSGNFLTTDSKGTFTAPDGWSAALPVTIEAPQHIRTTFLKQAPAAQIFKVHPQQDQTLTEIKGLATGIEPYMKEKDGYVDFALVSPTVKLQDIFLFNIGGALSPETDVISIVGKEIGIPSNLSVPKQKEKLGIFSFTVDKGVYRFKTGIKTGLTVVATRGRAQVSSLAAGQGPTLVNSVEFQGGGAKAFSGDAAKFDVPADQMMYSVNAEVVAPSFSDTEMMTSMALAKLDDTQLFLTDVKIHQPGETKKLVMPPNKGAYFIFLWSKKDLNQSKAASMMIAKPGQTRIATKFLPLVARPSLTGLVLSLAPPQLIRGVQPAATYVALSDVLTRREEHYEGERVIKKWEFYSTEWVTQIQVPVWPESNLRFANMRRWEALFYARDAAERIVDPYDFAGATHATRNFIDLAR